MAEVLDLVPESLTPAERLLLVAIAEKANDGTREGWPGMDVLTRRTGMAADSVQKTLRRLATHGIDVRVPVGLDKNNKPFYAAKGTRTTYRIPVLPIAQRADQDPPFDAAAEPSKAASSSALPAPKGRTTVRASESEGRTDVRPSDTQRADPGPAKGGSWSAKGGSSSAPSPQEPSKNPQTAAREPEPFLRYGEDLEALPGPLGIIARSLAVTHTDATLDEARAVLALVAERKQPKSARFYEVIANGGGFGTWLAEIRKVDAARTEARKLAVKEQLKKLRGTEPPCEHGTPAGRTPHPANGLLLCPECRHGIPAAAAARTDTTPEVVQHILGDYRQGLIRGGQPVIAKDLIAITTEVNEFLKAGANPEDLRGVARQAGEHGVSLAVEITNARRVA